jgi:hypothetical protein
MYCRPTCRRRTPEVWVWRVLNRKRERERQDNFVENVKVASWKSNMCKAVVLLSLPATGYIAGGLTETSQTERGQWETALWNGFWIIKNSTFVPDANCKLLRDSLQNWKCPQYKGRAASHTAFYHIEGATETQFRTRMVFVLTVQGLLNAGHKIIERYKINQQK